MLQNCITSGVHGYTHSITRIQIQKMIMDIHTTVTTSTGMTMTMGTHTIMITLMDIITTMGILTTMIISTDIHTMIAKIVIQTYPGLHLMKMIGPPMDTLTTTTTHTQQTITIMIMGTRTIMIIWMDIYTWIEITFAIDKR